MSEDALRRRLEGFESAHKAADDVDTNKLSLYTAGIQRKSKREREKDAAEAKRIQEEEDAAKAYKDFVASFEGPADAAPASGSSAGGPPSGPRGFKTFVRAGGSGSPSPYAGAPAPSNAFANQPPTGPRGFSAAGAPSSRAPPSGPSSSSSAIPTGPRASRPSGPPTQQKPPSKATAASVFDNDEPATPTVAGPKKNRAMDAFLEQLKRDQADRESRLQGRVQQGVATSVSAAAAEDLGGFRGGAAGGSFDTGDSTSTNLHVGNLPANVTTNDIGMYFAQFGPVASVKVMWPRDDMGQSMNMVASIGPGGFPGPAVPSTRRAGLNGFIAFMKRRDAEKALHKCDNQEWMGSVMRLGWGKGMPLPPRPVYVTSTPFARSSRSPSPARHSRGRSPSRSPRPRRHSSEDRGRPSRKRSRRSTSRDSQSRSRSRSRSRGRDGGRQRRRKSSYDSYDSRSRTRSRSRSPLPQKDRRWPKLESESQRDLLEDVASKSKQYGRRFEETMRDRERNNPKYDFLRDESLPAYHYFKMLMDRRYRAPSPPPPPYLDEGDMEVITSDDSDYEDEMTHGRRGALGKLPRAKLETMLRSISNHRDKVARVMVFALDRPDAAEEVVEVVIQSLLVGSTPVPRKIARLNVISDILHNCAGTPTNAWKYRSLFEARLPEVFTHLGDIHKSFPGRMKAEIFRKQIMTVVDVWENWLVFTPAVLQDLTKRLENGNEDTVSQIQRETSDPQQQQQTNMAAEQAKTAKPTFKKAGFAAVQADTAMGGEDEEEDLDGEVIAPSAPAAVDDVDGEPIDGEDIDGAPI